ncbi:Dual specificity protein phosphatase 21 [Dirofilaria immitis]|nr:Dual specificity protein phosphatase 21 [Dirofilaria immitis]
MIIIILKSKFGICKMTEIIPGLFICGVSSLNPSSISHYGITHIINATNEASSKFKSLINIQRTKLWIDDTPETNIYPHLEQQSDLIRAIIADGGKVLVHCVAGVSRSASICLAYLTKYHCRTLRDAYHLMAKKRPLVRPNIGFWRQLISFEQVICKKVPSSVRLIRDEMQEYALLPDVYLKEVISERSQDITKCYNKTISSNIDTKYEKSNSFVKLKFHPVLESLPEMVEASAS